MRSTTTGLSPGSRHAKGQPPLRDSSGSEAKMAAGEGQIDTGEP
jgi:hypothetical protein